MSFLPLNGMPHHIMYGLFFLFSISLRMISIAVPLRGFISQYSVSIAIDIYYRQAYSITINWILVCYLPWLDSTEYLSFIFILYLFYSVYISLIYIFLFVFILILFISIFVSFSSMAYMQTYLMLLLLCLSVRACLLSRQSLLPWLSYSKRQLLYRIRVQSIIVRDHR